VKIGFVHQGCPEGGMQLINAEVRREFSDERTNVIEPGYLRDEF